MSSATHTPGFNGPAIHAGQPRNAELVDNTKDNSSELLSVEPSNHSPFSPYIETTDTIPWIDVGEGVEFPPPQFGGGESKRGRGRPPGWTHDLRFVNQLYGPRLRYHTEEAPVRWGWSKVEAPGMEAWEALGPGMTTKLT